MAVGFNLVNGATPMTAEQATGRPDYMQALRQGMLGAREAAETVAKPKSLSEALLQAQLKNAHDRVINQYLPQQQESEISHRNAQTGLIPYQQRLYEAQAMAAKNKLDPVTKMQMELKLALDKENAMTHQKEAEAIEQELPNYEKNIQNAKRLKEIATNNPNFFGPGLFGMNNAFTGAPSRAMSSMANTPEYGEWNTLLTPFIAETARGLSSKPLALSLNTAIGSKPSFEEQQKQALGKIAAMQKSLEEGAEQARARYKELTGKGLPSSTYGNNTKKRLFLNGKPHMIPAKLVKEFLNQPGASENG